MSLPEPAHVAQIDGTEWGPYACMAAAGAMALDAYTGGRIRVGQAAIRAKQDDQAGGIGLDDLATAWMRGWGLTFKHGRFGWGTIHDRLAAGNGVVVTVNYATLGRYRAPGSGFTGAHALYLSRLTAEGVTTHDPLRRSAAVLPEDALRRAYTNGAGWGSGVYAGSATGGAGGGVGAGIGAGLLGAFYRNGSALVVYPRGSTSWTAAGIMATLGAADYFGSDLDPAAGLAEDTARRIFAADQGKPWTEALHASWAAALGNAAVTAGSSPLGGLAGLFPVDQLVTGLADTGRQLAVLGFILVLVLLGLYVTLGGRETVVKLTPAAVRAAL